MTNVQKLAEYKDRIISLIKVKGPSLPVQIARSISVEPIFASAFLSELKAEGRLEISNMRVGSSPLYYVHGQESMLENFSTHLNQREKEALELLRKHKALDDEAQSPVMRVALRAIKDFAIPKKIRINEQVKLFWKHFLVSDEELPKLLSQNPKSEEIPIQASQELQQPIINQTPQEIKTEEKEAPLVKEQPRQLELEVPQTKEKKIENIFEKKKEKTAEQKSFEAKKQKAPKQQESKFTEALKSFLEEKGISIIELELEKKKEVFARVNISTILGSQSFSLIAKDKKSVSDTDLTLALQKAQSQKMPALFVSPGKLTKKAESHLSEWQGLVKFVQLTDKKA